MQPRHPESGRPGGALAAPILVLAVVCITAILVMASLATFHLATVETAENSEKAMYLAEAAIAETMSYVHQWQAAGMPSPAQYGPGGLLVQYAPYADRPDAVGQVSFDVNNPWGYSTNNLDSHHGSGWQGTPVPPGMVHVVARGQFGSSIRTLEAFLRVSLYQFVLSTAGAINTPAPLLVSAEPDMATFANDQQAGTPSSSTLGANVGSNTSIAAGPNTVVAGDVVCQGAVNLANPSLVRGGVRQGPVALPQITITNYTTAGPTTPTLSTAPVGDVALSVNTYAPAGVTINGNLTLNQSVLYVDGNLIVNGGISGTGAVVVHGDVTLNGGADLNATNLVALLSSGQVNMAGASNALKYFQGLVYAEGPFNASNITIAGVFASNPAPDSTSSSPPGIVLGPNTQVVYIPSAASITVTSTTSSIGSITPNNRFNPGSYNPNGTYENAYPGAPVTSNWLPELVSPDGTTDNALYAALTSQVGSDPVLQWFSQSHPNAVDMSTVNTDDPVNGSVMVEVTAIQYNAATNSFVALPSPVVYQGPYANAGSQGQQPWTTQQYDANMAAQGWPFTAEQITASLIKAQMAFLAQANLILNGGPVGSATTASFSLNNFLSDQSPLEIVSWRER